MNFETFVDLLNYIKTDINKNHYLSFLKENRWQYVSSKDFVKNIYKLSNAFYQIGVKKGTTVAIISDSSPFWLMVDFALQNLGAISVPIFADISRKNLRFEIEDAKIYYMFIASEEKFKQLSDYIKKMRSIVTLNIASTAPNVISFDKFIENVSTTKTYDIEVSTNDIATIIYTSGTTGAPKGVELTHSNFMSQLKDVSAIFKLSEDHIALSFLPLAHIFERMVVSYYLASKISIYFVNDIKNVGNVLKEIKPTIMTVVPRLLDKIYLKMHENLETLIGLKRLIAKMGFYAANTKDINKEPSILDKIFKKLIYKKLLEVFGGKIKLIICGGAPLSKDIERFFTNIGVNIYQGYGLSETSPVICVNTPTNYKFATVGKKLPSIKLKVLDDGELLVKGPNVMKGYHNQPYKTRETIKNNWLYTGDLVKIDKDGFITIKGRKKELFKTSTGKYITAIAIEELLTHSKWIDYAIIVANNRPFVTALLFLEPSIIKSYAANKKIEYKNFKNLMQHTKIKKLIEYVINVINKHINAWERVKKFTIIYELPTIENQILTPSMKISRQKVYEQYSKIITSMYNLNL